jgi:hypothetical protein
VDELRRFGRAALGRGAQFLALQGRQLGRGPRRLLFADHPPHRIQAGRQECLCLEGRLAREQLVEQHAQAVDVAARINVQARHLRLLRRHVGRRADELVQLRIDRVVGESSFRRLGDTEVNDLGHGLAVVHRHEDVRGLDVAVDDALLVRVLDGLANLDEQSEPGRGAEVVLIAVVRDGNPAHQFHHEVGSPEFRRPGIEHLGDVGMVHQRQRLPLGLEARHD